MSGTASLSSADRALPGALNELGADKLNRRNTADQLFEVLRERILGHVLPSGVHLVEAEIAREFRISTTPVREALQRLVQVGLADRKTARGVIVHRQTAAELREIFEIRVLLEPAGLLDSARATDSAAWAALEAILAEAKVALDARHAAAAAALNSRFHTGLTAHARNKLLRDTLRSLADRHQLGSLYGWSVVNRSHQEWEEHCDILAEARAGRVERAAALLRGHIERSLEPAVAALEQFERPRGELPTLPVPSVFAAEDLSHRPGTPMPTPSPGENR